MAGNDGAFRAKLPRGLGKEAGLLGGAFGIAGEKTGIGAPRAPAVAEAGAVERDDAVAFA